MIPMAITITETRPPEIPQIARALDPVTLPLAELPREFVALSAYPGGILNACPDRWGIKVIDRLMGR